MWRIESDTGLGCVRSRMGVMVGHRDRARVVCHREFTSRIATSGAEIGPRSGRDRAKIGKVARHERCTTAAMALRMLALVALTGCFYEESSPLPDDFGSCPVAEVAPAAVARPTWYGDVEPIVVAKCEGCHAAGGIGPFALTSYSEVVIMRDAIRDAVVSRRMPPWQPDACCNHYRFDRSLSDAERDTLVRWIDQGFAAGEPASAPPVQAPPKGLPRVDLHAEMAAEFRPSPKIGADELRCFLLDHAPIERTRYITGFDFHPGARAMVHHVIVFAIDESKVGELERRDGSDGRPGW